MKLNSVRWTLPLGNFFRFLFSCKLSWFSIVSLSSSIYQPDSHSHSSKSIFSHTWNSIVISSCEKIHYGLLTPYISTSERQADIFTKPLGHELFYLFHSNLGIMDLHIPTWKSVSRVTCLNSSTRLAQITFTARIKQTFSMDSLISLRALLTMYCSNFLSTNVYTILVNLTLVNNEIMHFLCISLNQF